MDFRTTYIRSAGGMLLATGLLFSTASRPANAGSDPAIANFVSAINKTIGQASAAVDDERAGTLCASVINAYFDFDALARVTSAGAWEKMNSRQRHAYRAAFLHRARRDCVYRDSSLRGEPLKFIGVRRAEAGDLLVATEVSKEGQSRSIVVWRVRHGSNRRLRAVDVILDGRSLAIQARDDAKLILDRNSGDVDALIKSLQR
jgi:ABC-type transporter MlaC component